jgi:precorrin-8X/cobalt-precorrin-8 methylmutase
VEAIVDSLAVKPEEIEAGSFRLIEAKANIHGRPEADWQVLGRVIHTGVDFEYVQSLDCSDGTVEKGVVVLKCEAGIVTDTTTAL